MSVHILWANKRMCMWVRVPTSESDDGTARVFSLFVLVKYVLCDVMQTVPLVWPDVAYNSEYTRVLVFYGWL